MNRPQTDEYGHFYQKYVEAVGNDVIAELELQASAVPDCFGAIPAEKADFAYAEGKWTIKELLGHLIDTERVMAYRLLRISRNDATPLPGFDENDFVKNSAFPDQELANLIGEFRQYGKRICF